MTTDDAVAFARTATLDAFAGDPREHLVARVLDTLAATTGGFDLPTAGVVRSYTDAHHDGDAATVLDGDGNRSSVQGATLVNATAANALDVDDGHREVKGHPAAVVLPAALAVAEAENASVRDLLVAFGVGYELAVRAGVAIHATDGVYTGTGSWGAVGAAAVTARLRDYDHDTTAAALGTAEYHAPRTPIMRGVEHPGMTKDGIGWGAFAGVAAADLAASGFTASGTVFDESAVDVTDDLGDTFQVTRGYLKPYPCCRWAHPGVDAVLDVRERESIDPGDVDAVRVHTFEAATHLETRRPGCVEAAEYSYPYPVAAALARGEFTPTELAADARSNSLVGSLADRVELVVDPALDDRFPTECLARVTVRTDDGRTYESEVTRPRGARDRPLSPDERREKIVSLVSNRLPERIVDETIAHLENGDARVRSLLAPWQSGAGEHSRNLNR
jgi:2-methylcitrate dehydratase PrpD